MVEPEGSGGDKALDTLTALISRIWGPQASIRLGRDALIVPSAQRFLALPSPSNPRLLVPLASGRAARGAALANLPLRNQGEGILRRLLAASTAFGLQSRLTYPLWVGVDDPRGKHSLVKSLEAALGREISGISVAARSITPNYKPTLLLVGNSGEPLGYVKVGWNEGTNERLVRERVALQASVTRATGLRTPRCLAYLQWEGQQFLVVEPVPSTTVPARLHDPAPLHLVEAARSADRPYHVSMDDVVAMQQHGANDELDAAIHDDELVTTIDQFAAELTHRWSGHNLAGGLTHGDWVPWNLGRNGGSTWAWDWEHSERLGVPMIDVVHWYTQIFHIRHHAPIDEAFRRGAHPARARLRTTGASETDIEVVMGLAVLTVARRAQELHRASGLWRPGVQEGLITLLRDASVLDPS